MNYYWLHPGMRYWKWNGERDKYALSPYDPIDDGHSFHDPVFVCVDCLKAFHPHRREGTLKICPECKRPVYSVGPYFAAPSRKTNRGKKAWQNIIAAIERRDKICILHNT